MKGDLFCPFCSSPLELKIGEPYFCKLFQQTIQESRVECKKGCIKTHQYYPVSKAIKAAETLVSNYNRVIAKKIQTPLPIFIQEAYL